MKDTTLRKSLDKEYKKNIKPINEKQSYQISEETKKNSSEIIGLPFDKSIDMDFDDLEKHIKQKIGKNPTYDLTFRIDGIKIDTINDGPKLVLKKN